MNLVFKSRICNLIILLLACLYLQGCVSTSLEDAAPKAAPSSVIEDGPSVQAAAAKSSEPTDLLSVPATSSAQNTVTSSSFVDLNNDTQNIDAIAAQAPDRSDEFPDLSKDRRGAAPHLSAQEAADINARLTELLLERAQTPQSRADYAKRLAYLRRLAKSHAAAAEAKIEN